MIKRKIAKRLLKLSDAQVEKLKIMLKDDKRLLNIEKNPKLEALLISHSIEKGMSLDNPRRIFGEEKVDSLLNCIEKLNEDCFEYDVSMSILKEFFDSREYSSDNLNKLKGRFELLEKRHSYNKIPSGINFIKHSELRRKTKINFKEFVFSRHDIRKTSDEPIDESKILEAIKIASFAPSACNRQPWKIYYSMNEKNNEKLGSIVSGNKTFSKDMKYYCAVVLDNSYFSNRPDEFRQIYLNAGIFLTYFVLALHSLDIGSCIMQFTGYVENAEEESRRILKLKPNEQVMAIIGFGKYQKKIKHSKAGRRPIEQIATKY